MSLTSREKEILALLLEGKSNREIAATLGTTEQVIKNRVGALYSTLGIERTRQLLPLVPQLKEIIAQ